MNIPITFRGADGEHDIDDYVLLGHASNDIYSYAVECCGGVYRFSAPDDDVAHDIATALLGTADLDITDNP